MDRRTILKMVAAGAMAPGLNGLPILNNHCTGMPQAVPAGTDHSPQFFTAQEFELVDQLMELIIPADSHSPGAHAAKVSAFADLMISTGTDELKQRWRQGLALIHSEAAHSSLEQVLATAAQGEANPKTALEKFFVEIKQMTVNGYYTSAIGIHADLQYQGNTYLESFPGCTHPEHQS